MTALVVALALVLLPLGAWADDEKDKIQPDRSGASTSTATVGAGAVQIEAGFNYGHERIGGAATQKRFGLEAAVRVGLTTTFEVGVLSEPLVRLRNDVDDTGHGDFTLNAKWRFFDPPEGSPWPSLAVLPFVTLPVTEEPIGSGKTDFGAILLASFELPWQLGLDLNAGLRVIGQTRPSGYLPQAFVGAGLSRDVAEGFTLFTDLVYTSREERDGRDTVTLDGGIVYRPARNVALDASVVTSLAGNAPDWTVRAGVSVRFGR
jgi:outer membrane putative beta-barrel porin/alpha-amylase